MNSEDNARQLERALNMQLVQEKSLGFLEVTGGHTFPAMEDLLRRQLQEAAELARFNDPTGNAVTEACAKILDRSAYRP
jgi:hypothetical protein